MRMQVSLWCVHHVSVQSSFSFYSSHSESVFPSSFACIHFLCTYVLHSLVLWHVFFSFFTFIFSLRLLHVIHEDLHLHHLHLEIQSIICLPIETSWPFVRLGRHMRNSETVRALNGPQENGLILQSFNGQNYTFPSTVSQFLGGLFFVFPESLDIQTPPVRRYLDPKNIPKNIFKHLVRIGNKYYLFDDFLFFLLTFSVLADVSAASLCSTMAELTTSQICHVWCPKLKPKSPK